MLLPDHALKAIIENNKRNNEPLFIEPFIPHQVKKDEQNNPIVSYGLSSAGYDIRLSNKYKIFTATEGTVIDPLNHNDKYYTDHEGDSVIIPPNSYILGTSMESFNIPDDVMGVAVGKSTLARLGAIISITPLEPGWQAETLVIEISNATPLPLKLYAGMGVAQVLFFQTKGVPEVTYADRGGKYQNQVGIQTALL